MKIQIIEKRPFKFHDKALDMDVNGFMYSGLTEEGAISFSSQDPSLITKIGIKFDPAKAVEVPLRIKIWDGKAKFQHDLVQDEVSGDWIVNPEHSE